MFKSVIKRVLSLSPIEIFIILSVAAFTLFLVKFYGTKYEWRTITVEIVRQNWINNYDPNGYHTPFWLSDKVKIGQTEKDNSGNIIARLTNMENYERDNLKSELFLTLQVKCSYNKRTGQYLFKDKYLDLGSGIELNLNNILLAGQIIDNNVPVSGYPTKTFLVTIRDQNQEPWIINQVAPHDTMFNQATNTPVAEILTVKTEPSSSQIARFDSDNHLQFSGSQTQDLVLTAKITAYQKDGRWYFAGIQNLKAGNPIFISTDKVNLRDMQIENIQELKN